MTRLGDLELKTKSEYPWKTVLLFFAVGVVLGAVAMWKVTRQPDQDTHIAALQDSVAVIELRARRDSLRVVTVQDSLVLARAASDAARQVATATEVRANAAISAAVRRAREVAAAARDSCAAVDTIVANYEAALAGKDTIIGAVNVQLFAVMQENNLLYSRVAATDALVVTLREQAAREKAVAQAEASLAAQARSETRRAVIRERVAEGGTLLVLVALVIR